MSKFAPLMRKGVTSRHSSGGNLKIHGVWKTTYFPGRIPPYTRIEVAKVAAVRVLGDQHQIL